MTETESNLDAELERRLVEWARWFLQGCGYKVGYPPVSSTFWACYQVAKTRGRSNSQPLPSFPPAEEVDDWVRELSKWRPRLAKVLRCHYFTLGPARDKAQRLGISRTQYGIDLEIGKGWLIARLFTKKLHR